jgi:acetylglutamate kinase
MKRRPWIIKAGGELMGTPSIQRRILLDLAKLAKSKPLVFVHGGGPQIETELAKNKIPNKFVSGRRVTSPAAMIVVEKVLSGSVNKDIAGKLGALKVKAAGLSCRDGNLVVAKPYPRLGRAAKPVKVNPGLVMALVSAGFLPVISSIGTDGKGGAVNINADEAASALAVATKAEHLIFLTNISGVKDKKMKTIARLKISGIAALVNDGTITKGMIPKVQSARKAVLAGVGQVNILNGTKGVRLASGTAILK